jgi:soluble lytic murein transglycosylase-like protein
VQRAADRQHLAAALVHAVIAVESGYRPRALSPRGAAGLMQLMPATAARYGVTDVFDPAQNIDAGTRHLRTLLDRYGQDAPSALAAYNAGSARARWRNAETAAYVPAVLLRAAMPNPKVSP